MEMTYKKSPFGDEKSLKVHSKLKFGEKTYLHIPAEACAQNGHQSCENVLHAFIKELECQHLQRANISVFEEPLHAVVSFRRNRVAANSESSRIEPPYLTFTVHVFSKPRGGFLIRYVVEKTHRRFPAVLADIWGGFKSKLVPA